MRKPHTVGPLLLTCFAWCSAAMLSTASCLAFTVPGVRLDGVLEEDEWAGAVHFDLADGEKVLLRSTSTSIDIGLRGFRTGTFGYGCVFLALGERIYVLHASARLGTAVYHLQDGTWSPEARTYSWKSAADLWLTDGWRSHPTESTGAQEFQISRRLAPADQRVSVAFAYVTQLDGELQANGWPRDLTDATRDVDLLAGHNPDGLDFAIAGWYHLDPPGAELPPGWDREQILRASPPEGTDFPGLPIYHRKHFDQRPTRQQVLSALTFEEVNWSFEPESGWQVVASGQNPTAWKAAVGE